MSAPLKIIWTHEEDDHFLSLVLQGYQIGKIAESVGRARSTVGLHIKDLINQLPPREQLKYREKRPVPPGNPPTLHVDHAMQVMRGWTPEMDAKIIELRGLNWSYKRIGKEVRKGDTSVNDRLNKLAEIGLFKRDPAEERVLPKKEGRADFSTGQRDRFLPILIRRKAQGIQGIAHASRACPTVEPSISGVRQPMFVAAKVARRRLPVATTKATGGA